MVNGLYAILRYWDDRDSCMWLPVIVIAMLCYWGDCDSSLRLCDCFIIVVFKWQLFVTACDYYNNVVWQLKLKYDHF
jgi:hypothetical protein